MFNEGIEGFLCVCFWMCRCRNKLVLCVTFSHCC